MNADDRFEDPAICVAKLGDGTMIPPSLAELLNPVDPSTFHVHVLNSRPIPTSRFTITTTTNIGRSSLDIQESHCEYRPGS
jgi:hypothetical protein